jgi:putative ATP-binding cassette transporter
MFRLLLLLWRNTKLLFIASLITGIVSGLGNALLIGLIHLSVTRSHPDMLLIGEFTAFVFLAAAARLGAQALAVTLAQETMYELVMELSRKILASPLRHLEEIGISQLLATLTDDVTSLTAGLISIANIGLSAAVVLACCVYLGVLSFAVLVAMVALIVVNALIYRLCVRLADKDLTHAREQQDILFGHFQALTEGAKELRLYQFRADSLLNQDLQATAMSFRRSNLKGRVIYAIAGSLFQLTFFSMFGVVIFLFPRFQIADHAVVLGCLLVLMFMMTPAGVLVGAAPAIGQARVALEKLNRLGLSLETPALIRANLSNRPCEARRHYVLELRNVVYRYCVDIREDAFELGPIDLKISTGEVVFLVGGNGSGKTTLAKIITGLYKPKSGEILLNGRKIVDPIYGDYRQNFAAVFADSFLFNSVSGGAGPERGALVAQYLSSLRMSDVAWVEDGLWSSIKLSQGQKKRLGLIDALLTDRPIFVLDEWAAEQDPLFRDIFYLQLLPELVQANKSVIVISHDERYYHIANRIVRLERGKLIANQTANDDGPRFRPVDLKI